jgi:hypothetical protein
MSGGYAVAAIPKRLRRHGTVTNKISVAKQKTMKLTIKQKIRNWLMNDDADDYSHSITIDESGPNIQSQGFRLNVYGASGGTIVETTKYDRKHDENRNSLHVITEDKDLGEELSKIITMEQLR